MHIHLPDDEPHRCPNQRNHRHSDGYIEVLRCMETNLGPKHFCSFPKPQHVVSRQPLVYSKATISGPASKVWFAL